MASCGWKPNPAAPVPTAPRHGCTTSVVSKLFGIKRNRFKLENSLGAQPGEQVVIGIPDELLVQASVRAYLLPLLVMMLATAVGSAMGLMTDTKSAGPGWAGHGFFWVRWATRQCLVPTAIHTAPVADCRSGHLRVEMPNLTRS